MNNRKPAPTEKREKLRNEYWPDDEAWIGTKNEKGWFSAPRTLPLILQLLDSKNLSGKNKPSSVYLDLLARHIDEGIIEITNESDCAFAAGYSGTRAVRTWRERMKVLEDTGFIKSRMVSNQSYKYVLLVHPTIVVKQLRDNGKVSDHWWDTYRARQMETKEATYEDRQSAKSPTNVIQLNRAKAVRPIDPQRKARRA
jgi:hypothetical protein